MVRLYSRRKFLTTVLALGGAASIGYILTRGVLTSSTPTTRSDSMSSSSNPLNEEVLDLFAKNIVSGGPPRDGIPSIDRPEFVTAEEAEKFLVSNDVVFGVAYKDVVRAYPQIILVWHEIVNDVIAGEMVSITYCPLTGTAIGYKGRSRVDGKPFTFGTTGKLVNSNLLMYDRQTESYWPQILGIAITGPRRGEALEEIPVYFTTWERWRSVYPETEVLSTNTGYARPYGLDPYGSYRERSGYYFDKSIYFPVMAEDDTYHPKEVFVGVKLNGEYLAIPKEQLRFYGLANSELGGKRIVAVYDPSLDVANVFLSELDGRRLNFKLDGDVLVDIETRSEWDRYGKALSGRLKGRELQRVTAFDVFWFAWHAFFPSTLVLQGGCWC